MPEKSSNKAKTTANADATEAKQDAPAAKPKVVMPAVVATQYRAMVTQTNKSGAANDLTDPEIGARQAARYGHMELAQYIGEHGKAWSSIPDVGFEADAPEPTDDADADGDEPA